jgi:small subunit ribosomal protein S11
MTDEILTTTDAPEVLTQEEGVLEATENAPADTKAKKVKKGKRQVARGRATIQCTYNNTIVTIADMNGNALAWSSAGHMGFKGAKKSTPYAASQVVADITEKVKKFGVTELEVYVRGV